MGVDRLMFEDFERADRIGEFWGYPESRAFAEPPPRDGLGALPS
jgi:hypothetical protein